MESTSLERPDPVILIIADISGYTRYMTANAKTLAHSQTIITELVKAIVKQVELPMEVAKLEGDAVFLFCRKATDGSVSAQSRREISAKVLEFFQSFSAKVSELSQSTTCTCNACTHIEKLRLKVVVHSGEALFHRVFNFIELAGVDVIIVHRLLKNSVGADQYLLLTDAAARDLVFDGSVALTRGTETYDDIGRINTLIYLPDRKTATVPIRALSFRDRFRSSRKLFFKLWFAPFSARRSQEFRNVESSAGPLGKKAMAVFSIVLAPLFIPVGMIGVLVHTLLRSREAQPDPTHLHSHPEGCDCGHH